MGFIKRLAIAIAIFFGIIVLTGFVAGVFETAVGRTAKDIATLAGFLAAVAAGILYLVNPRLFRRFAPPQGGARAFVKRLAAAVALFLAVVVLTAFVSGILAPAAGRTAQEIVAVAGVLAALAAGVLYLLRPGLARRAGG